MKLNESLLPEFDKEMANTRKVLERVPEEKLSWKPHQKSYSMEDLATHLANLPSWTMITLTQDSIDMAPPDGNPPPRPQANTREEILELFDKNIAAARETIANTADAEFFKSWSLLSGGKTIFTMSKIAVLRSFVLSHNVHHRAQLCVYLRLNDIPVPAIYGPSADEG
jgi:uncharacterized damage-inducible protein DinB